MGVFFLISEKLASDHSDNKSLQFIQYKLQIKVKKEFSSSKQEAYKKY